MSAEVPRPAVRGVGSRAAGSRIAETVARGLEIGGRDLANPQGGASTHIPRLVLRLPAGAGEAEVARALREAVSAARSGGRR
jgi:hypothetical protein